MPVDTKKPLSGRTITTPKAPIRSKQGPYLTPRLAGTPRPSPSPDLRKDNRPTVTTTAKATPKDAISTPVKNFLSSNITPRSGSRKARVDSANTTPNTTPGGTPTSSRPTSVVVAQDNGFEDIQGLVISNEGFKQHVRSGSVISNGTVPTVPRKMSPDANSSKFFHASEASSLPKKQDLPSPSATGFVYADGRRENTSRPKSQVASSQFYRADGLPDSPSISKSPTSPITSPYHPTSTSSFQYGRQRSTSPLKDSEIGQRYGRRRPSNTSALNIRSSIIVASPQNQSLQSLVDVGKSHAKTRSLSSVELKQPEPPTELPTTQSPVSLPTSSPMPTPLSLQTQHFPPSIGGTASPLTSPSRMKDTCNLEQLNALAANARRERKVLDLEISNSSLLTVNRTLEREMRKRLKELRRYKRLESTGRLSLAAAPNDRAVSGTTTISTLSLDSRDGYSSGSDSLDEEEDEAYPDLVSNPSVDSLDDESLASLSPAARAVKDASQRARDEKRLQLDLAKHQQLLTASLAMNASLKRCLTWTEELILEGKRALAYTVRPSEVKVGGRVLRADNEEDRAIVATEGSKGLLSPTRVLGAEGILGSGALGGLSSEILVDTMGAGEDVRGADGASMAEEGKEFGEYLESLSKP